MIFLLAGVSVRALAQSAARAGYPIVAADYFGDSDLASVAPCRSLSRPLSGKGRERYSAWDLPGLAEGFVYDALAYVANLENHPRVVADLARGRPIAGNDPETLIRARHWPTLRQVCAEEGLTMPPTLFPGEETQAGSRPRWLRKPVKSGGGHGIGFWDGKPLGRDWYLQAWTPGTTASAVVAANGRESVVLGVSEQIVGDRELGAHGFRHCGNIMPLAPELGDGDALLAAVADMAARLTRRFGLRGVYGLDFIVAFDANGYPVPALLEINPRPPASAELIEERGLGSVFDIHVKASSGFLPKPAEKSTDVGYTAKGIAFASLPCQIPENGVWKTPELRDVGRPGDAIAAGCPICSIVTRGATRKAALSSLYAAALGVRRDLAV